MTEAVRTCPKCGETKPLQGNYAYYPDYDVYGRTCNTCRYTFAREQREKRFTHEERKALQRLYNDRRDQAEMQAARLRSKYGIGPLEREALEQSQDGLCPICQRQLTQSVPATSTSGHIDHDHDSGAVRGILCSRCNRGLGSFVDDPDMMLRAIDYLRAGGVPLAVENHWVAKRLRSTDREFQAQTKAAKAARKAAERAAQPRDVLPRLTHAEVLNQPELLPLEELTRLRGTA